MAHQKLVQLLGAVDGIPSVEFYKLEAELYFMKENIKTAEDNRKLEEATQECINRAIRDKNTPLQLILRWHQIENVYCRVFSSPDDVKRRMSDDLEKLRRETMDAVASLEDTAKYCKHATLCRLFAYIACGYVDLGEFKQGLEVLALCEGRGWHLRPVKCDLGPRLSSEHIGNFHYAKGRLYSFKFIASSSSPSADAGQALEWKRLAVENFELSKKAYMAKESSHAPSAETYHVCEVAMCCLQQTRVYLDLREHAINEPLSSEDLETANKCLLAGVNYYDVYTRESGRGSVRVAARVDWWRSLLCYRMYQSCEQPLLHGILLEQAKFHCDRSAQKLKNSGYSDKGSILALFVRISDKLGRLLASRAAVSAPSPDVHMRSTGTSGCSSQITSVRVSPEAQD